MHRILKCSSPKSAKCIVHDAAQLRIVALPDHSAINGKLQSSANPNSTNPTKPIELTKSCGKVVTENLKPPNRYNNTVKAILNELLSTKSGNWTPLRCQPSTNTGDIRPEPAPH